MKNTDSSEKRFDRELLNKWLIRGAKALLAIFIAGLVPFFQTVYEDIKDLQANDRVQNTKINNIRSDQEKMEEKLDDLHWYLIRRNDVKIDKNK